MEFFATNPATGARIGQAFQDASHEEIDRAAEAARRAAAPYAAVSGHRRADFLEAIAEELMNDADLLERAHAETALPMARLEGERGRTCNQLRLFAGLVREGTWVDARIDPPLPDRKPLPRPDVRRILRPIGPVAVFGASNFPLAFSVAGGDTASALAAGNPVVVKAHPAHPGTSELAARAVIQAAERSGMPEGVFGMVHGASPEVSLALVRHPAIAAVGFTGSQKAGRALFDAAASRPRPIPVFAEMSSLNPIFLLPDALETRSDAVAAGLAASVTLGVGQFCTKPGLVFARSGADLDGFKNALASKLSEAPPGTMLHAGIASAFRKACGAAATAPGVSTFARAPEAGGDITASAVGACISWKDFRDQPALTEEVFGPFLLIVELENEEDFLAAARSLDGQLTATLHTDQPDSTLAQTLAAELARRAGRLLLNGFPTGVEVSHAMHHGGPYPATTDVRFTSVGTAAILRWARPVCFQNWPQSLLPDELKDANPLGILRLIDGTASRDAL